MQVEREQVQAHLSRYAGLFPCAPVERSLVPGLLVIGTGFLYPDGDELRVFLAPDATLSDMGEAQAWMWMQNAQATRDDSLTPAQQALLAELCQTYQLEYAKKRLFISLARVEDLVGAVLRLAQGMLAIAWSAYCVTPIAVEDEPPAAAADRTQ
jgi:Domain of unknown function DUF1828